MKKVQFSLIVVCPILTILLAAYTSTGGIQLLVGAIISAIIPLGSWFLNERVFFEDGYRRSWNPWKSVVFISICVILLSVVVLTSVAMLEALATGRVVTPKQFANQTFVVFAAAAACLLTCLFALYRATSPVQDDIRPFRPPATA